MAGLMLMAVSALGGPSPLTPSTAQQFTAGGSAIPITINPNSTATPYKDSHGNANCTIVVPSSVGGTVEKVSVTLNGFTHTYPNDVQVLLVGPNGSAVVLMANLGHGQSISSPISFTIDDFGTGASPTVSLGSGNYYAPPVASGGVIPNSLGANVIPFPAPAPSAPGSYYSTLAAAFGNNGCPVAGTWALFVVDDNVGSSGAIQSWTLNVWQAPTVVSTSADVSGVTVLENGQFNFVTGASTNTAAFTVNVSDPTGGNSVQNLIVSASLQNGSATAVLVAGQGTTAQTLMITPKQNLNGSDLITVFVSDGSGQPAVQYSKTVALTITPVEEPPVFSNGKITKQSDGSTVTSTTINQGQVSVPFQISVASAPNNPFAATPGVLVTSDRPDIVAPSGVMFDSTTASTRNFTVVPNGTGNGTAHLTLWLYDGTARPSGETNSLPLTVTVTAAAAESPAVLTPMYAAPGPIILAAPGNVATSFLPPISGLNGAVDNLTVTLNGLVNVDPATLGLNLIWTSGDGKTVKTASLLPVGYESGIGPFSYAQITFSDAAAASTPSSLSGIVNLANINAVSLQAEQPSGSLSLASTFSGVSAAGGQWQLQITGGTPPGGGTAAQLLGGWVLTISAAPAIPSPGDIYVEQNPDNKNAITINFSVSSIDGKFSSATVPSLVGLNPNLATINTSKNTWNPNGFTGTGSFQLSGNANQWGTNALQIMITDNGLSGFPLVGFSPSFNLGFEFVNHAPSMDFIPKQVTSAGVPTTPFVFQVYDTDNDPLIGTPGIGAPQNLTVTASSDNTSVLPNENIVLQQGASYPYAGNRTWTLTLYPLAQTAVNVPVNVTITVDDNSSVNPATGSHALAYSETFPLVVNPATVSLFPPTTKANAITLGTPQSVGSPYPSTTTVSPNLVGTVADVKVNVYGVTHLTPEDMTLLLVHTDPVTALTRAVLLMEGAGGTIPLNGAALIFSDFLPNGSASPVLPFNALIPSGTYRPTTYSYTENNVNYLAPFSFPPEVSGGTTPPGSGYGSELDSQAFGGFFGMNPNGPWQLFAYENGGPNDKGGVIDQGWQILLTTAPNIQLPTPNPYPIFEVPAYNPPVQTIPIVVGDIDPNVTVTATSGNQALIPNSGITPKNANVGGSSANIWNLQITPAAGQVGGPTTITVTATDSQTGLSDQKSFNVQVQSAKFPPAIVPATATKFTQSAGAPLVFSFNAYAQPISDTLTIGSITTSDTSGTLLPAGNVSVNQTEVNVDGSLAFTVTATPVGIAYGGPVTVSFPVTDKNDGLSYVESFTVTFNQTEAWINPEGLTIPPGEPIYGTAYFGSTPYQTEAQEYPTSPPGFPTTIAVGPPAGAASVPGLIASGGVGATLSGFGHGFPSDLDILLVHRALNPSATKAVLLMSHAGDGNPVNNLTLTFTNAQAGILPIPGGPGSQLSSGTFSPAQYGGFPTFPGLSSIPYPANPTDLTAFDGMDPNGYWDLYVLDDTYPTGGQLNNGWFLTLSTGPGATWSQGTSGNAITIAEGSTSRAEFDLADVAADPTKINVTVGTIVNPTFTLGNGNKITVPLITSAGLSFANIGNAASQFMTIVPAAYLPSALTAQSLGPATITLNLQDANGNTAQSPPLAVTVTSAHQGAVVSTTGLPVDPNTKYPMITVNENVATTLSFSTYDWDSTLTYANISVTSDNTAIVPNLDLSKASATGFPLAPAAITSFPLPAPNVGTVNNIPLQGVPEAYNINFDGTGTPTLIHIRVNDGNGNVADQPVEVFINHVEQAPTLTALSTSKIVLPASGQQTFSVTVSSVEAGANVTVTPYDFASTWQNAISVVPASASGPSGSTLTFTVTSLAGKATASGGALIGFQLNDNSGKAGGTAVYPNNANSTEAKKNLEVAVVVSPPAATAYGNSFPITINGAGLNAPVGANPPEYPSIIFVGDSYAPGIYNVQVVIPGFSASVPQDVDMLLVGPGPNEVLLMSGAGGAKSVGPLELGFSDGAQYAPLMPGVGLFSSTNNPSDLSPTDVLATPAPLRSAAPGYGTRLHAFAGVNPFGNWSLFVSDRASGDTVSLPFGWTLLISTEPTLTGPAGPITLNETIDKNNPSTTTLMLGVNEDPNQSLKVTDLSATATAAKGPSLLNVSLGALVAGGTPQTGTLPLTITPVYLAAGSDTVTVTVTRADGAQAVYTVNVNVNVASVSPSISRIGTVSTPENTSTNVQFVVSVPDTSLGKVAITATTTATGLLDNSRLAFAATGNNAMSASQGSAVQNDPTASIIVLNITPYPNQSGVGQVVTINVSDPGSTINAPLVGPPTSTSLSFSVNVTTPAVLPVITTPITAPASLGLEGGVAYNLPVTVTSSLYAIAGLSASSQGKQIVSVTTRVLTGSGTGNTTWTVAIGSTAVSSVTTGQNSITLTATDTSGQTSQLSIPVTVVPRRDQVFTNPAFINIYDFESVNNGVPDPYGEASLYPSEITVPTGAFKGLISDVTVTLNGFGHLYPSDVGVLLVSPTGQAIELMENASRGSVSGLQLSFDANATPLPEFGTLESQSYVPADFERTPNIPYVFPQDATGSTPQSGYTTDLTKLNAQQPGGVWRLYVTDQVKQDVGSIQNGWSLDITTAPWIQFANTTVANGKTASAANGFQILDDSQVPLNAVSPYYNFIVISSAPGIVPATFTYLAAPPASTASFSPGVTIVNSGDDVNYTAYATPLPNQTTGSKGVTITIDGSDPDGQQFGGSFLATFTPFNAGPNIFVANAPTAKNPLVISSGTVGEVAFNFNDTQSPPAPLVVTVSSDNPTNLPLSALGLSVNYINGAGTLQIAPLGNASSGNITLTATETKDLGLGAKSTSVSFPVQVISPTPAQSAPTTIVMGDPPPYTATLYPSPLFVTNLSGGITKATVTLDGLTHSDPSDLSILLVGPNGEGVVLMSQAGGTGGNPGNPVNNVFLAFDDNDQFPQLPAIGQIVGGTYHTSPFGSTPNFAPSGVKVSPPPPTPPYALNLTSAFDGIGPNGWWYLYVMDQSVANAGYITNGWSLKLQTTGPQISPIQPQQVQVNENAAQPAIVSFSVSSLVTTPGKITVSASLSGSNTKEPLATLGTPQADSTGTNYTLAITPALNLPSAELSTNGTAAVTISATDTTVTPNVANTLTFPLTVIYEAQPPVIAGLPTAPVKTPANQPATGSFTASTPDLGAVLNAVVAGQQGANIGTLTLTPNGANSWNWTFIPNGTLGQATWTFTVSYGSFTVPGTLTISTTSGSEPTITGLPSSLTILENQVGFAYFSVGNLALATVTNLTGTTDNTNLVQKVTVSFTGTEYEAAVSLVPYQNNATAGPANVFVGVGDQFGTNVMEFSVSVIPVATPPVFGPIADQYVQLGTSNLLVPFTVSAPAAPITNFTARVSNPTIFSGPITFAQTGPTNYTATINLAVNRAGVSTVTFVATDSLGSTAMQSFALVTTSPTAPTLAPIANVTTPVNTPVAVPMVVTPGSVPLGQLSFNYQISNSNLVSSIVFNTNKYIVNGATVTATIVPASNQAGTANVTFTVSDGVSTVSQPFVLTVQGTPPTLGAIANVTTAANTPVAVPLVVTPGSVPLGQLSFNYQLSNSNLVSSIVFNTYQYPVSGATATAEIVPANNQAGTTTVTVSVSDGITTVSQSFTLTVQGTPPSLGLIANVTTPANTPVEVPMVVTPGTIPLGQLTFSYQISNSNLVSSIVFNTNKYVVNGITVTATIVPASNQAGAATVTFAVSDGLSTVNQTFVLSVLSKSPSLGPISSPVTTLANTPVPVPMVVTAGTIPLGQLSFSYQISNSNLVSSIVFNTNKYIVNGATVTATIVPASNQTGTANVTFNVSDGITTVSQSFELVVSSATGPTLSFVLVGKVLKITFTGVPNATYTIQGSSDLKTWTQLGSPITADASGKVEYDATVASTGWQFIRALFQ